MLNMVFFLHINICSYIGRIQVYTDVQLDGRKGERRKVIFKKRVKEPFHWIKPLRKQELEDKEVI